MKAWVTGDPRRGQTPADSSYRDCRWYARHPMVITIGAIIYSHYSQVRDKRVMKEGVERDKERIRYKRKMKQQQQIQSNTEKENKKGDNR